ncbi:FadR/GntR family transcriptional regulator [Pleomorphomonas carboxyditropha]|uniref:FadR/GntR family transcriptional regulator n=1 Tax=Pleomorphomonas carboxyditropha TaxID=2023338 RepID=UPI001A9C836E|nr:FadR/GntR family transcriptional regulator [Pleomorphomonas carboxyditropha]
MPVGKSDLTMRRRSLAEMVVGDLTDKIKAGAFHAGDKLPTEPEVMSEFGVSRTVVREAISRMQAAGLVETRHGIGTFVLPPSSSATVDIGTVVTVRDVMAMLELRISLETEAAALAAIRRSDEHLERMGQAVAAFEREIAAGKLAVEADFDFHLQIARATGNRYFESVFRGLGHTTIPRTRLDTARIAAIAEPDYLTQTGREHQAIMEGIARHDAESARAAMRMHLSNSRERLRKIGD